MLSAGPPAHATAQARDDGPDQLAAVRADPARRPAGVEELLRFAGPAQVPLPAATAELVGDRGHDHPRRANT